MGAPLGLPLAVGRHRGREGGQGPDAATPGLPHVEGADEVLVRGPRRAGARPRQWRWRRRPRGRSRRGSPRSAPVCRERAPCAAPAGSSVVMVGRCCGRSHAPARACALIDTAIGWRPAFSKQAQTRSAASRQAASPLRCRRAGAPGSRSSASTGALDPAHSLCDLRGLDRHAGRSGGQVRNLLLVVFVPVGVESCLDRWVAGRALLAPVEHPVESGAVRNGPCARSRRGEAAGQVPAPCLGTCYSA